MKTIVNILFIATVALTAFVLGTNLQPEPQTNTETTYIFAREFRKITPIVPTKEEDQVTINWIRDKEAVEPELQRYKAEHGVSARGLAEIYDGYCNIYAYDFDTLSDREAKTFLHEVTHCFKGYYHD